MEAIDLGAHFFFQSLRRPWLDPVVARLTDAGDTLVLTLVASLAALLFLALRRPQIALAVALSGSLSYGLSEMTKRLVGRERPPDVLSPPIPKPDSKSFPSGHATSSMAVYGAVGLGLAQLLSSRRARGLVIGLGFFLGFLIGLTRLYLGVHFLFDVVGGWTLGVACALFGHWVGLCLTAPRVSLPELSGGRKPPEAAESPQGAYAPRSEGLTPGH
jgi:undecaprenyl-diphosphatase